MVLKPFSDLTRFPGGPGDKKSACSAGEPSLILGQEYPLEKGMATHSSILAWRIPWTEETGGLQSMGLQSRTQLSNQNFHEGTSEIMNEV